MNDSILRRVSVLTVLEAEAAVGELLSQVFGTTSVVWHDLESEVSTVSVYPNLTQDELTRQKRELRARLAALEKSGLRTGLLRVTARKVKPEDWSESWKRHFKPIEIGNSLLIKPSWNRRKPRPAAAVVVLDPGMSFGTGHHPTTRFCLEELVAARNQRLPQSFLDIGCGTGVLAISAEKLGYAPVVGFDFDPVAVRVARENAEVNLCHVTQFSEGDVLKLPAESEEHYDVICANLIYDVLVEGRIRVTRRLKPTGVLILAGILNQQFEQVQAAYQELGLRLTRRRRENEWTSGSFRFDESRSGC